MNCTAADLSVGGSATLSDDFTITSPPVKYNTLQNCIRFTNNFIKEIKLIQVLLYGPFN